MEVMPPDTNRGPKVAGGWIRLGGRKLAEASCRDEVLAALLSLRSRVDDQVFTVREVFAEMQAAGTRYAESTVFKTMQRMKLAPARPPYVRLERVGQDGFRMADCDSSGLAV
ncbi:MAG TPA: hypothetical protein VFA11_06750 [Acidimicrobiales bacterium]|nr:hypothetical protein [Acidimicrobiales bacterium]